jgi:hypothetical protein
VSSINRSHRQGSAGVGGKDQPKPCQASGYAGTSSLTRNTTSSRAPGVNRTPDTRFRKPVLYPLSYGGSVRLRG